MANLDKYNNYEITFTTETFIQDGEIKHEFQLHRILAAGYSFGDIERLLEMVYKDMGLSIHTIKRLSSGMDIEDYSGEVWKLTSRLIHNNKCWRKTYLYVKTTDVEGYKSMLEKYYIHDDISTLEISVERTAHEDILCRGYGVLKDVPE